MKNPTVTIGVSAYNEADNIKEFLRSVLSQKENGFVLKEIIVISDGSTDKTVDIVKTLKSKKIRLIDNKKNEGLVYRLNQLYSIFDSDILIQSDADCIFGHKEVVSMLVNSLKANAKVYMVGGKTQPLKQKTFTGKAVVASVEAYHYIRKQINNGNNVYTAVGPILGFKREFVKKIKIPSDMLSTDRYMYLRCVQQGYLYKYIDNAFVYYMPPQSLADQLSQSTRFKSGKIRMYNHLPKKLIDNEYKIPKLLKIKGMFRQFLKNPILSAYIFIVNRYSKLVANRKEKTFTTTWRNASSKKLFN